MGKLMAPHCEKVGADIEKQAEADIYVSVSAASLKKRNCNEQSFKHRSNFRYKAGSISLLPQSDHHGCPVR